jgi:hypothetical protein
MCGDNMRTFNKEGTIYGVYNGYWVDSELGNDLNGEGTCEKPFKSLVKILELSNELANIHNEIKDILKDIE